MKSDVEIQKIYDKTIKAYWRAIIKDVISLVLLGLIFMCYNYYYKSESFVDTLSELYKIILLSGLIIAVFFIKERKLVYFTQLSNTNLLIYCTGFMWKRSIDSIKLDDIIKIKDRSNKKDTIWIYLENGPDDFIVKQYRIKSKHFSEVKAKLDVEFIK